MIHRQRRQRDIAQIMEELVEMAKKFKEVINRGDELALNDDEIRFYDALATNESAVHTANRRDNEEDCP